MKVMHITAETPASERIGLVAGQKERFESYHAVLSRGGPAGKSAANFPGSGNIIEISGITAEGPYKYDDYLRKQCDSLFKKIKPDLVHIHYSDGISVLPVLNTASSLYIKKVLSLYDNSILPTENGKFKKLKYVLDQCDVVVCRSEKQKEVFRKISPNKPVFLVQESPEKELPATYKAAFDNKHNWLFYKLGHMCNSKCLYCVAGEAVDSFIDFKLIKKDMEQRAAVYGGVIFTGGEPTMHPKFSEILAVTYYLGLNIQVQSNIRLFKNKKFAEKIRKYNPKIIVCMNSSREDVFDLMADAKGAFRQTIAGVKNLLDTGIDVEAKIIITNQNYGHLKEIALFIRDLGINSTVLIFPTPMGFAEKNFMKINPRYRDVLPAVHGTLQWGIDNGMKIETENFPPCLLDEKYHRYSYDMNDGTCLDGVYLNVSRGLYNAKTERIEEQKQYLKGCGDCVYYGKCEGIYKVYVKNFGDEEFNPVMTGV